MLGEGLGSVDVLTALPAAGVGLVIDDFGTGYSNLVHAGTFGPPAPAEEIARLIAAEGGA